MLDSKKGCHRVKQGPVSTHLVRPLMNKWGNEQNGAMSERRATRSRRDRFRLRGRFLLGMSHAACTVNVVTTDGPAGRHGVTVSAMVSVSADTPRRRCSSASTTKRGGRAVLENRVFCVNVLRDDQAHISDNFAVAAARAAPRNSIVPSGPPNSRARRACWIHWWHLIARDGQRACGFALRGVRPPSRISSSPRRCAANLRESRLRGAAAFPPATHLEGRRRQAGPDVGCYQVFAPFVVPALVARLTSLHRASI